MGHLAHANKTRLHFGILEMMLANCLQSAHGAQILKYSIHFPRQSLACKADLSINVRNFSKYITKSAGFGSPPVE